MAYIYPAHHLLVLHLLLPVSPGLADRDVSRYPPVFQARVVCLTLSWRRRGRWWRVWRRTWRSPSGMSPWPTVTSVLGVEYGAGSGEGVSRTSSRGCTYSFYIHILKLKYINCDYFLIFVCASRAKLVAIIWGHYFSLSPLLLANKSRNLRLETNPFGSKLLIYV